jgi:hypothetical protein
MNPSGCLFRVLTSALGASIAFWGAGCSNIFVSKHKVLVDAISAPGVEKPSGKSYRLLAKKSVVTQAPVQVPVVKACVDAALIGEGMYEPPPNVAPDLFIEVGYGTDTSGKVDPASRETFLQLSARDNPDRAIDRGRGAELWDVRVAVLGIAGRVETAMPLLCAVAAKYIATDTHMETKIEIPQNSPMVSSVRETAIKALEAKAPAPVPATPPPTVPPAEQPSAPPSGGPSESTTASRTGSVGSVTATK